MSSTMEGNPFVEALNSDALRELLQDDEKSELAVSVKENLIKLSAMFSKLSNKEKGLFVKEFKDKFINQIKNLSEMVKQKKEAVVNAETQQSTPVYGAGEILQEELNFYITVLIGLLVVLFIVFFGYKLYLSLTEKERKREEKAKAKQAKKKK